VQNKFYLEVRGGGEEDEEGEVGGGGQGGEMAQTMYAHVNKRIKIF
jgi:hypothetical protein